MTTVQSVRGMPTPPCFLLTPGLRRTTPNVPHRQVCTSLSSTLCATRSVQECTQYDAGNVNNTVADTSNVELSLTAGQQADEAENAAPVPDLQLSYSCDLTEQRVLRVTELTVSGLHGPLSSQQAGLPSFRHLAEPPACVMSQAPAAPAAALLTLHVRAHRLHTAVPLQLLPGPPVSAVLEPGHPFLLHGLSPQGSQAVKVEPGAVLPAFSVKAKDAWGNLCVPSANLSWSAQVHSAAIKPSPVQAAPHASGAALVQNASTAKRVQKDADGGVAATLQVVPTAHVAGLEGAVQAAKARAEEGEVDGAMDVDGGAVDPAKRWPMRLLLQWSRVPVSLTVYSCDQVLSSEMVDIDGAMKKKFAVRTFVLARSTSDSGSEASLRCDQALTPCILNTGRDGASNLAA